MRPLYHTTIPEPYDAPPDDKHLAGLATLLDHDRIREILLSRRLDPSVQIDKCVVSYVRYKPGTNCLVAYEVTYIDPRSGDTVDDRFFGKCHLQSDFQNAVDKAAMAPSGSCDVLPSVIILEDQRSIIYNCLSDRTLDSLPLLFDSRKLVRTIHRVLPKYHKDTYRISDKRMRAEVVRFKPEKRALVRITSKVVHRTTGRKDRLCIYARHYVGDMGQVIYETMRDLWSSLADVTSVTVPEPLAYLPDERILLLSSEEGERLSDLLAGSPNREVLRQTAFTLARLHTVTMPSLQMRAPDKLITDARATADSLKYLLPESRPMIDKVFAWLQELNANSTSRYRFVHGDFYHDQVLIKDHAVTILDFDRSYRGDELADVGNFCAHLLLMGQQQRLREANEMANLFIDEYVSCTQPDTDRRRIMLWTIFGLFQLAVGPFRVADTSWRKKTSDILDMADTMYHDTRIDK